MVREFEDAPVDNLLLILDAWRPTAESATLAAAEMPTFPPLEEAISLVATICWEWCRRTGDRLTVGMVGRRTEVLGGVTSRKFGLSILERLAVEEGHASADAGTLADRLHDMRLPRSAAVIVSTRSDSFADALAAALHRPVTLIDVGQGGLQDFYEKPPHAP